MRWNKNIRLTTRRALKSHFATLEEASDEPGVNEARGYACEFVAWQFLTNLTERDAIDLLLHELPQASSAAGTPQEAENGTHVQPSNGSTNERTPLLTTGGRTSSYFGTDSVHVNAGAPAHLDDFVSQFENLSALEIAAVSGSKKFISQRPVQKIINGIWRVGGSHFPVRRCTHIDCVRATLSSGKHSVSTPSRWALRHEVATQ